MKKGRLGLVLIIIAALLVSALVLSACELTEPEAGDKFFINDNINNEPYKNQETKDTAIAHVTDGLTNLREYLDTEVVSSAGYYMGVEFNIDALDPNTLRGGNFRLKIQAHLFTYKYEDDEGNPIYKYYDKSDGKYYDEQNADNTRQMVKAEDIHNELIKNSDILIEWYNGTTNEMLIGMYFDGLNSNTEDPGNVLYLNIQGYKRSFAEFGDTVLYQQLVRLLMSLSVEKLLVAGGIQGDAGVSSLESLFQIAVTENSYKVVLNQSVFSTLFTGIDAKALANDITETIQGLFAPFADKLDPLTLKYLGFKFSVMGGVILKTIASDMQFFTGPDPTEKMEILKSAHLSFTGAASSGGETYDYVSDITFDYDLYPPDDMKLDRDFYIPYEYGQYEFTGNLYIPLINSNFDALIRTDMQQYDNSTNNVFMEFRDIATHEVMIGGYYRNERTYVDITGMQYLYGWVDLNSLGFPKVYDEHLDLAKALGSLKNAINNGIVSIVDGILSPDKNDKENHLLEYIMAKMEKTERLPKPDAPKKPEPGEDNYESKYKEYLELMKDYDELYKNWLFSKNTETLTIDMVLVKHFLEETGNGSYTTRQIIDILDSMLPYTMDQLAIMLGAPSAENMLDNSYFTITFNVDTNEITIKLFTTVNRSIDDPPLMIFQLDIVPVVIGQKVNIAEIDTSNFNPLGEILTYSAEMNGKFVFSAAEVVDLSKLLSATIGENSGLNTPYKLPTTAGLSMSLLYDQTVTDHEFEGKMRKQGRTAFDLSVWITGQDASVILRLASDDVAFNSDVYKDQPARADELGYVWVSIECVTDNGVQRIPKVKVREDIFMSSMQAYMNGTKIEDTIDGYSQTDVNLSITSVISALCKDAYVVMEPEQLEITSSNDTLKSIFRVEGLIGNINVRAGFKDKVEGLQAVKGDYKMYQVGSFANMTGNSPYDTVLHKDIGVYFYEDYSEKYHFLSYDFRIDRETGAAQVYNKGGKVKVTRDAIVVPDGSFFKKEDQNNQDIALVRFPITALPFIYENGGRYLYTDYNGEEQRIENQYITETASGTYVYYLGISDMLWQDNGAEYYYFDGAYALYEDDAPVVLYYLTMRDMLFEYDPDSIKITEDAKTQYAPRINGSFMGETRRYILTITTSDPTARSMLVSLDSEDSKEAGGYNNTGYYSQEDREHKIYMYDDEGSLMEGYPKEDPIVMFLMEPSMELSEEVSVNMKVGAADDKYHLLAEFAIDWERVTLKGYMEVTEVTVAPGTMGEKTYPVRIIVVNREIVTDGNDYATVYIGETEKATLNVPVVDEIFLDPYDYLLAKNEYFAQGNNYIPDQFSTEMYLAEYKKATQNFVHEYFAKFDFDIHFNYSGSELYGIEDDNINRYIASRFEYRSVGVLRTGTDRFLMDKDENDEDTYKEYNYNKDADKEENRYDNLNWNFDLYEGGNNLESKISTAPLGAIYLHTYFKGQLIALRVNIEEKKIAYIKFGEDDEFDPRAVNGSAQPGDDNYIYGHYVANYFDEDSYTIPVNPIFYFTDGTHRVFDMTYVSGLTPAGDGDNGGNYILKKYALEWYNPVVTNVGSAGSYYAVDNDNDGIKESFINRPFYVSNVVREDGIIVSEGEPEKRYETDQTSTSINWLDIFSLYKPEREMGRYTGRYMKINLIEGDSTASGFMTSVLRITVECPKLDVAYEGSPQGDDFDLDGGGNKVVFRPNAVEVSGGIKGYYIIDPLSENPDEVVIPDRAILYFTADVNDLDAKLSKHEFKNIRWRAYFDYDEVKGTYYGDGHFDNASGVSILREEPYIDAQGVTRYRTYFLPSLRTESTTKIMAKIGSDVSGYQYITVCVRVLSKDPRAVDFYDSTAQAAVPLRVERADVDFDGTGFKENFIFYSYYVDTFTGFNLPDYIIAHFGINMDRHTRYSVSWRKVDGGRICFSPDSILNMVATVGSGEASIDIYLSIIVANCEPTGLALQHEITKYYVKVGDSSAFRFENIGNVVNSGLMQVDFDNKTIGLVMNDGGEKFVQISMSKEEGDVPAGKIGLYLFDSGEYKLSSSLYPQDFIEEVYSSLKITFGQNNPVSLVNPADCYVEFESKSSGMTATDKLSAAAVFEYYYDNATGLDRTVVSFKYSARGLTDFYPRTDAQGLVSLYSASDMNQNHLVGKYTVKELGIYYVYSMLAEDIRGKTVSRVITNSGDVAINYVLNGIYTYNQADRKVKFFRPDNSSEELVFNTLVFSDATTIGYEELKYRLSYLNAHRTVIDYVAPYTKETEIVNFRNIFDVNDVVEPVGKAFSESTDYVMRLGTGEGAYDMTVRLHFNGGYRLNDISTNAHEVEIQPYTDLGYARYGMAGYILAENIATPSYDTAPEAAVAVLQDGRNVSELFVYGITGEMLSKWYVEQVSPSFAGVINVGDEITALPQSVVYSPLSGEIVISTLTSQGFRLRRKLVLDGVPTVVEDFNSINSTGLLIRGGKINIDDVYDYTPLTTYFSGSEYLPTTLTVGVGGRLVTVSNVKWKIADTWYGPVTDSVTGQVSNGGELTRLTYKGNLFPYPNLATAEVMGWVDGDGVEHDKITLELKIAVKTAEVVILPWNSGSLRLDTTTVEKDGIKTFLVEVDAFNDRDSSAVNGGRMTLPNKLLVQYAESGAGDLRTHTFEDVAYMASGSQIEYITYDNEGINMPGFGKDHIDLTVNLGLGQTLNFRFRFYNKTVESVTALIDLTDTDVRNVINESLNSSIVEKENSIVAGINQTRIKANIERLMTQMRLIRNTVVLPSTEDFMAYAAAKAESSDKEWHASDKIANDNSVLVGDVKKLTALIYDSWTELDLIEGVAEITAPAKTVFETDRLYNYALVRLKAHALSLAEEYAAVVFKILADRTTSEQSKINNLDNAITNLTVQTFTNGYDEVIGDYLKTELAYAITKDMDKMSISEVAYASAYKNTLEAYFDYDSAIREIYRVREYVAYEMISATDSDALNAAFIGVMENELQKAMTKAKAKVVCSQAVYDAIDEIFYIRLGLVSAVDSVFAPVDEDINAFVSNYALSAPKTDLRKRLRTLIGEAMSFEPKNASAFDYASQLADFKALIDAMVADNVDSILNFDINVSSIRRNLLSNVDITGMLNIMITRGVNNYIRQIYTESAIAREIKKAQEGALIDGYFYIDPYSDYRAVPTKIIVNFAEEDGGFAYTYTADWSNNNVSGNVTYMGNRKNSLYGYLYGYYAATLRHPGNAYLELLYAAADAEVGIKSWAQIKSENRAIYNTLVILDTLVESFYDKAVDGEGNELTGSELAAETERRILTLYKYYLAGIMLTDGTYTGATTPAELAAKDLVDMDAVALDFDRYCLDNLNAEFYNTDTDQNQRVSLIVEVLDRTMRLSDLKVMDDAGLIHTSYVADNPFEVSVKDLPHKINVGGEIMDIVWRDVQITPKGNLESENKIIYGNIHNANGQEVSMRLTVARWDYAGIYTYENGSPVLLNPLNFYFNNALEYSNYDSYEVRFNVYTSTGATAQYRRITFYPEDSKLLVNSVNDDEMAAIDLRRKYIIYWDPGAKDTVLSSDVRNVSGTVSIGNAGIGDFNIATLADSNNTNIPTVAYYNHERMSVSKLGLSELDGDTLFGVSGEVTIAVDENMLLPKTAEVQLNRKNIIYDNTQMNIRLIWNVSYIEALTNLTGFVRYAYKDVDDATQYAINIIMTLDRGEAEEEELIADAIDYIKSRTEHPELYSDEYFREQAKRLLVIDEKYDIADNANNLKGGSTGNKMVTVLIKYGSSAYICETRMLARVLYADYTPIKYLEAEGYATTDGYNDGTPLTELKIAVRTDYWDENNDSIAYTSTSPYNSIGKNGYRLLEQAALREPVEAEQSALGEAYEAAERVIASAFTAHVTNLSYTMAGTTVIFNYTKELFVGYDATDTMVYGEEYKVTLLYDGSDLIKIAEGKSLRGAIDEDKQACYDATVQTAVQTLSDAADDDAAVAAGLTITEAPDGSKIYTYTKTGLNHEGVDYDETLRVMMLKTDGEVTVLRRDITATADKTAVVNIYKLVKVTDIAYDSQSVNGKKRSRSFKINGVEYASNLLALSVA